MAKINKRMLGPQPTVLPGTPTPTPLPTLGVTAGSYDLDGWCPGISWGSFDVDDFTVQLDASGFHTFNGLDYQVPPIPGCQENVDHVPLAEGYIVVFEDEIQASPDYGICERYLNYSKNSVIINWWISPAPPTQLCNLVSGL